MTYITVDIPIPLYLPVTRDDINVTFCDIPG